MIARLIRRLARRLRRRACPPPRTFDDGVAALIAELDQQQPQPPARRDPQESS